MANGPHYWLKVSNAIGAAYIFLWVAVTSMNSAMIVKLMCNRQLALAQQNIDAVQCRDRQVTLLLLRISLAFSLLAIPDIIVIVSSNTNKSMREIFLTHNNILSKVKYTKETVAAMSHFFVLRSKWQFISQTIFALLATVQKSHRGSELRYNVFDRLRLLFDVYNDLRKREKSYIHHWECNVFHHKIVGSVLIWVNPCILNEIALFVTLLWQMTKLAILRNPVLKLLHQFTKTKTNSPRIK